MLNPVGILRDVLDVPCCASVVAGGKLHLPVIVDIVYTYIHTYICMCVYIHDVNGLIARCQTSNARLRLYNELEKLLKSIDK